jgi:hypothetical protein
MYVRHLLGKSVQLVEHKALFFFWNWWFIVNSQQLIGFVSLQVNEQVCLEYPYKHPIHSRSLLQSNSPRVRYLDSLSSVLVTPDLQAAKDVSASPGVLVYHLFRRIHAFLTSQYLFRHSAHNRNDIMITMLGKALAEVLIILALFTKEMQHERISEPGSRGFPPF